MQTDVFEREVPQQLGNKQECRGCENGSHLAGAQHHLRYFLTPLTGYDP
jgi:hypothetical protein